MSPAAAIVGPVTPPSSSRIDPSPTASAISAPEPFDSLTVSVSSSSSSASGTIVTETMPVGLLRPRASVPDTAA